DRPQTRRREFQEVPIRAAKIDAAAATIPLIASFNRYSARSKMPLPTIEFVPGDGERHVQRTIAAAAGNDSVTQGDGLSGSALAKGQKHISSGHRISRQPVVSIDRLQPEHALIEGTSARHIFGVNRGF